MSTTAYKPTSGLAGKIHVGSWGQLIGVQIAPSSDPFSLVGVTTTSLHFVKPDGTAGTTLALTTVAGGAGATRTYRDSRGAAFTLFVQLDVTVPETPVQFDVAGVWKRYVEIVKSGGYQVFGDVTEFEVHALGT